MTEPCASSFYRAFVGNRQPISPELQDEIAKVRRARLTLVEVAKRVYDELDQDQDLLAIPLGLAIEQYEHPFDHEKKAGAK